MSVTDIEKQNEKPIRVYIDLVGDLFHAGDVRHLEQARAVGDVLVVGVFSDSDAARLSHVPVMTMEERVAVVAACRWVDEVLPAAPVELNDGFLDDHTIDYVCLSDDFGDETRGESFAALMETDRAVVLPWQDAVTTGALVARIVDRPEGALPLASRQGKTGAHIHPSWQGGSEARALAQLDTKVSALGAGQGAIVQALGSLAAARFSSAHLFRGRASGTRHWAELIATFAAETIARSMPVRDDVAAVAPLAARVRSVLPRRGHLVLVGAQAVSVAEVLAEDGPARITVLQPTPPLQRATPLSRKRGAATIDVIRCDWDSAVETCPAADVCAVLDPLATSFLLTDHLALWQLSERLTGLLLLPGRIAADATETWRPLNDHTRFVFSDAFVRRNLHEARFLKSATRLPLSTGCRRPKHRHKAGCRALHIAKNFSMAPASALSTGRSRRRSRQSGAPQSCAGTGRKRDRSGRRINGTRPGKAGAALYPVCRTGRVCTRAVGRSAT